MIPLERVRAASRFVASALDRHPEWAEQGLFDTARGEGETARLIHTACDAIADEPALMQMLRRLREREQVRIAVRDLSGWAPLDETLGELSDVAQAFAQVAITFSTRSLQARYGVPRSPSGEEIRPVLLGMGKLGGRELNFSSDIDLILCYTQGGETDGARSVAAEEYFARMVQDFTRLIAARTADGFVHRVDWMLRPFGSAGAPAASFAAMEDYYQVHGREWERYALVKARPIAGDLAAGAQLLSTLRPFVYRRYLDFNAIGHLRELKRLIAEDVQRKGMEDNIKLGRGGIRELEFIVQSFQLVRGGSEPALRDHRLRPVLRYLGVAGHLPPETTQALDAAYVFLRRCENAIQMDADEQTHALPAGATARTALCAALDALDWPELAARIEQVRALVEREFDRVFARGHARGPASPLHALLLSVWEERADAPTALEALREAGYGVQAQSLLDELRGLRETRLVRAMSQDAQARLLALLDTLFAEGASTADGNAGLPRVLRIVQAVAGRSTYLTLLRENDTARAHLVRLCAASPWLSAFIERSPVLLDVLLDARTLYAPPERDELVAELRARFAGHVAGETDAGMDLLRRFQKEMTLRIAAADLAGALPLVKVSDRLTWLAEAIVAQALHEVRREMQAQFGEPATHGDVRVPRAQDAQERPGPGGKPAGFAVIAYGKFGGLEMSYGSDLDVVFLHDCDDPLAETLGGERSIAVETWLSRMGQRVISWLSAQTPAGRAYEVDIELRPDGRRGMMVASIAGFERYQLDNAWTWEHQALTRARFAAGDAGIGAQFERVRAQVLGRPRDASRLRGEIADMRERMHAHLEKKSPGRWDLKQARGGLIDVEFITQFLVLRDAHRDPDIIRWSDNWRQLEALERAGSLSAAQKDALIGVYRGYRACLHRRALNNEDALVDDSLFAAERETIRGLWRDLFGSPPASTAGAQKP